VAKTKKRHVLPRLGSGKRFKALAHKLAARGAYNPEALAAFIGRKKYGKKKFSKLSHHSR
jgi:hypothetical protein